MKKSDHQIKKFLIEEECQRQWMNLEEWFARERVDTKEFNERHNLETLQSDEEWLKFNGSQESYRRRQIEKEYSKKFNSLSNLREDTKPTISPKPIGSPTPIGSNIHNTTKEK